MALLVFLRFCQHLFKFKRNGAELLSGFSLPNEDIRPICASSCLSIEAAHYACRKGNFRVITTSNLPGQRKACDLHS